MLIFIFIFADSRGSYDPLKVDVWSLGATTWELVHGDPPFSDLQDACRAVGTQLPPVHQPDAYSRSFHDFLHLCSQPAASRPDPDELLNVRCPKEFWLILITVLKPPHPLRLILYGLRVLAQRLSDCWDSAGRSTSSYFYKVAILIDRLFTSTKYEIRDTWGFFYISSHLLVFLHSLSAVQLSPLSPLSTPLCSVG